MDYLQLRYQRSLFVSFYFVIIIFSLILVLFNSISILLKILDPDILKENKKREKRYVVRLQRERATLPKEIVENLNENEQKSEFKKFLSDEHSQSASANRSNTHTGNIRLNNKRLTSLEARKEKDEKKNSPKKTNFMSKNFTKESIFGKNENKKNDKKNMLRGKTTINQLSTSTKDAGAERYNTEFSLSTYKWNYTPYIRMIKERIRKYISPPPAFYLGLIRGKTFFKVGISQNGELIHFSVIRHFGNSALRKTTEDVMSTIFKLPPLPPDFPEKDLTLRGAIFY